MRYFLKEVPKTPIWLPNGVTLKFETLDGRLGYYATEDQTTIEALKRLEAEHKGGVFEISPETYDRDFVKKKPGSTPFDFNSVQRETVSQKGTPDTLQPRIEPAVPAEVRSAPAPVPQTQPKAPRIGRRKTVE